MPRKLKQGDELNGFVIEECVNTGAMALSYAAQSHSTKVFFKQYISPTVLVDWYSNYTSYQEEIKRRIQSSPAKQFIYGMLDYFEWSFPRTTSPKVYYQVFEWVDSSQDMEKVLDEAKSGMNFDQKVIIAKVMMNAIFQLHAAGVIHCDLKPANIIMIHDPGIRSGYRVKLIDMDFSILKDRKAPWHDSGTGYVGTPDYFSPEHLTGEAPVEGSDVFTCGLILYELLVGKHPYVSEGDEEYTENVRNYTAQKPKLSGKMPKPGSNEAVENVLYKCLDPDPEERPTAKDVVDVLGGRLIRRFEEIEDKRKPGVIKSGSTEAKAFLEPIEPAVSKTDPVLELIDEKGGRILLHVDTDIGQTLCRQFGEEALYWSDPQFSLKRKPTGWFLVPNHKAKHETILNGDAVTKEVKVKDGDAIGAGKAAAGIVKLPLIVNIS